MSPLFQTIGDAWYKDEVGSDKFIPPDMMDCEYAEESTLFDIKRRTKRFSSAIGANWYDAPDTPTIDDLATDGFVFVDGLKFDTLAYLDLKFPPTKTQPLSLDKPLPPVPKLEHDDVTVQDVLDVSPDRDSKFQAGTRVNRARFDYLFADADETEVTTIHDDDQDSLVLAEIVEDEDDADPEDVGPSTPPRLVHHDVQATPEIVHHDPAQANSTQVFYRHHPNANPTQPFQHNHPQANGATAEVVYHDPAQANSTQSFYHNHTQTNSTQSFYHNHTQANPTQSFQHHHPQASPPQTFQHNHPQANGATQDSDLTGIDLRDVYAQAFLLAGISTTTNDLIENHLAGLGTNLAAPLIVDQEHESDKAHATDAFFNGSVEESPSPYHAPLLDGETGYGNFREGYEEFPKLWRHEEPKPKTIAPKEADAITPTVSDDVPEIIDTTLTPCDTQTINKPDNALAGLADRAKARKAKKTAELANLETAKKAPIVIDLTVEEENASESSSTTKKRRARSSFATKSTIDVADEYIQCLYTKKVRVTAEKDDDEVFSVGRPSTYSLITQPEDDDDATFHTISNPGLLSQITGLKGFAGQFEGLATTEQAARAKKLNAPKVPVYMGQASHLNNLILHKDIHFCPKFEETEYTPESAPVDSDIGRCLSYGQEHTDKAAEVSRTVGEEALRTEAHRECASARLEGVVVGFYRYFQGHLTVEEYHERKMCICWQVCECSKLCTQFADLVCPCATKVETNCH